MPVKSIFDEFPKLFRRSALGMLGQGLAFVALLCPVFFGHQNQLSQIVFVSALATVSSQVVTLGIPQLVPTVDQPVEKLRLGWLCIVLVLLCAAVAETISLFYPRTSFVSFAGTLLLLTAAQSSYSIQVARAIRSEDSARIAKSRLFLGLTALVGALIVSVTIGTGTGYLTNATVAQFVAAFSLGANRDDLGLRKFVFSHPIHALRRHIVSHRRLIATVAISASVSQIPGLITPQMGSGKNIWALAVRLLSGFETLAGNIFGPLVDSAIAANVRSVSVIGIHASIRQAKFLALAIVSAALLAFGITVFSFGLAIFQGSSRVPVLFACCSLITTNVYFAMTGRVFYLLRDELGKLKIELARVVLVVLCLLIAIETWKFFTLGVLLLASLALYEILLNRSVMRWSAPK